MIKFVYVVENEGKYLKLIGCKGNKKWVDKETDATIYIFQDIAEATARKLMREVKIKSDWFKYNVKMITISDEPEENFMDQLGNCRINKKTK